MKKIASLLVASIACGMIGFSVTYAQEKLWGIGGSVFHMNPDGSEYVESFHGEEYTGVLTPGTIASGMDGYIYGSGDQIDNEGYAYTKIFRMDATGVNLIHSFDEYAEGAGASLVDGADGFIYGVSYTPLIGRFGYQIFKMRYDGSDYVEKKDVGGYAFLPYGLMRTSSGAVIGISRGGGTFHKGFIYRIRPNLTGIDVIHNFTGESGIAPFGKLIEGQDGNLYGTTMRGGAFSFGVIFKITLTGEYTKLFDFDGNNGRWPQGGLVQDEDGFLYGTTTKREKFKNGLIFRIKPDGSHYTRLYVLDEVTGWNPSGDVFLGTDGFLYGQGFRMKKDGTGFEKLNGGTIYFLRPDLIETDVYVTSPSNGSSNISTASTFRVKKIIGASSYTLELSETQDFNSEIISIVSPTDSLEVSNLKNSTLYYARVKSSMWPEYGPTAAFTTISLGVRLWGITTKGGTSPCVGNVGGTIFSISLDGTSFAKHHDYDCAVDTVGGAQGKWLQGSPILGQDKRIYVLGKSPLFLEIKNSEWGSGIAGEIVSLNQGGGNYTVLYDSLSIHSYGELMQASNGNFYVTDSWAYDRRSAIRRFSQNGSTGSELDASTIYKFRYQQDGREPRSPLVELPDGYLYGTTNHAGTTSRGTLYKIKSDGSAFTKLWDFEIGNSNGAVIDGGDGYVYGMTLFRGGTVYKIKTDGSDFQVLRAFSSNNRHLSGFNPYGELILVNDVLYGMTSKGGHSNVGTIFSLKKDGSEYILLHHFNTADGSFPLGSLTWDNANHFYGMTSTGGVNNMGVVFRINIDGSEFTKLYDFSLESGGGPDGNLLLIDPSTPTNKPTAAPIARKSADVIPESSYEKNCFHVYPNPFKNNFSVALTDKNVESARATLSDLQGRTIQEIYLQAGTTTEIGEGLIHGVYILRVRLGDKMSIHRLIKQ